MGDPGLAMVEIRRHVAIMDRAQVLVGIVFFQDMEIAVPLLHRLGIDQEVIFIGKRPPDIPVGGKPRREIGDIAEILLGRHVGIAPAVIGVKDDDVGLDAERAKCGHLPVEMLEEGRVRPVEILLAVSTLFEASVERLVDVIGIVLRETRPCGSC